MRFKTIDTFLSLSICDRLTRLEPAYIRYPKLFDIILTKCYTDTNIKNLSKKERVEAAAYIINQSFEMSETDDYIFSLFNALERIYFKSCEVSYQYLSIRLNIYNILNSFEKNLKIKENVLWLDKICKNKLQIFSSENAINEAILPVKKIILCEGQTEYYLLNTLFSLFDLDLNENCVYIIPAGGKNQVIRKLYDMSEYCKIPLFVLLDNDAIGLKDLITPKLEQKDRLYILNSGEFEDLIPKEIIKSTINYIHKNDFNCNLDDFDDYNRMAKNIELIYKKYGFGEFKKAKFASSLNEYILNNYTKKDFLDSEITKIIDVFKDQPDVCTRLN